MDLTGEHFGVFEVWGPIGEGGMSRVWLARHRELSIPVIIKTLRDEGGEASFARLRNEARLMARIPNPRVVRAVDLGVHQGCPYLAQEYVDGIDLSELARRRGKAMHRGLPLWFVCHVAREVALALHSAHQTGVLHRDVKPSNLFDSPQTGVRLGDFGLALARSGTTDGAASGTLRFVAPEALRGALPTRQCDVYSLGATAYDLFYGRPPFLNLGEILGSAPPDFPAARSAEEAYFQHVLARMLERDTDKRFASIAGPLQKLGALARSLRPVLAGVRIGAGAFQLGTLRIECTVGDLADATADGIVNSANDHMNMRTGVGAALRARGGQVIEDEAMSEGGRALGECIPTSGGALACKHVLHAVSAWKEASCIARTTQRAFLLAEDLGLRTLAVPALGTGVAKVAPESSAYATASALYWHVLLGGSRLREVRFVLYDKRTYDVFVEQISGVLLGDAEGAPEGAGASMAPEDPSSDETMLLPQSTPDLG